MIRRSLILTALALTLLPGIARTAPGDEGFVSLFNGKDLSGWKIRQTGETLEGKTINEDKRFQVDDGAIRIQGAAKIEDIYTTQEFGKDFVLKLEFRAWKGANSGLYIRGSQLQVRDYPNLGPYKDLKNYKSEDWNTIEVVVTGQTARCTCNGELVEAALKVPAKGGIGLQSETNRIDYRNIRIKEAK